MELFTLKRLFGIAGGFDILSYQRGYAWENSQHKQLIENLRDAEGYYYIGHFLFEKIEDDQLLSAVE